MFQSTPHLSGKANVLRLLLKSLGNLFQSTPHLSGKANLLQFLKPFYERNLFQSTPHLSGKANFEIGKIRVGFDVSIHASPQRQGEQIRQVLYKRNILVSIHASPQRQGELRNNIALHLFSECFNPRLTSAARRTLCRGADRPLPACFNPRLTSAARRTRQMVLDGIITAEFQSTPHLSGKANKCESKRTKGENMFQYQP